jgi:lipopolysaccharide/colanic/teichoic acid biosynthesis glycosyltransferase
MVMNHQEMAEARRYTASTEPEIMMRPVSAAGLPAWKRAFDLSMVLIVAPLALTVGIVIALAILLREGRPVFYRARRVGQGGVVFRALKFRTMRAVDDAVDRGVSGGDKTFRISPLGAVLRRTRLDELPQLWNILRGDMSFVGPRPPLRTYVELRPELYARVLQNRPGVTGLATLRFHAREEALLSRCETAEETHAVYLRRCVPAKARLDLIYARHGSVCFDIMLMFQTLGRAVRPRGAARR